MIYYNTILISTTNILIRNHGVVYQLFLLNCKAKEKAVYNLSKQQSSETFHERQGVYLLPSGLIWNHLYRRKSSLGMQLRWSDTVSLHRIHDSFHPILYSNNLWLCLLYSVFFSPKDWHVINLESIIPNNKSEQALYCWAWKHHIADNKSFWWPHCSFNLSNNKYSPYWETDLSIIKFAFSISPGSDEKTVSSSGSIVHPYLPHLRKFEIGEPVSTSLKPADCAISSTGCLPLRPVFRKVL